MAGILWYGFTHSLNLSTVLPVYKIRIIKTNNICPAIVNTPTIKVNCSLHTLYGFPLAQDLVLPLRISFAQIEMVCTQDIKTLLALYSR